MLFCWLAFGKQVGQPLDEANTTITSWMERISQRPSTKA